MKKRYIFGIGIAALSSAALGIALVAKARRKKRTGSSFAESYNDNKLDIII